MSTISFPASLNDSFNGILNSSDSTNWAIYSYDKGGNDLKLAESGDGGLQELEESFDEGKVQYAFARVQDPNSGLNKFVFISWCGEGVPVSRKGLFNSHVQDALRFFKGFHVHINARSRQDVEPAIVLRKVRDSSGAKYSVHKETGPSAADQANTSSATVGSNYKPIQTSPKPFSSSNSTTQPPHVAFQQQQQPDTRARLERERREREEKERFEAEQKMARLRLADQEASDRKKREEQQQQKQQYEQELLEKEERERNARGSRVREERERREREEREREAAAFKERENRDRLNEVKRQREVEKASSFTTAAIVPAVAAPVMPSRPSRQAPPVASTTRIIKVVKAKVLYEYTAAESNEIDLVENEILTDVIQLDEGWWQATKYDGQIGLFPANYVELFEEEVQEKIESVASATSSITENRAAADELKERERRQQQEEADRDQRLKKEKEEQMIRRKREEEEEEARRRAAEQEEKERQRAAAAAERARQEQEAAAAQEEEERHRRREQEEKEKSRAQTQSSTLTAIALYDYEAGESNELGLRENDIISNIIQLDDGWWQGTNVHGQTGLFPANYVEIRESTESAPPSLPSRAPAVDLGVQADALYDYEAAESNELSLHAGDRVTNIEFVSDDWWQGNVNGHIGLFPANYVERI